MGFSVDSAILACISPSGKTARTMEIIRDSLESLGIRSEFFRIGRKEEEKAFLEKAQADGKKLIFMGSPVYVNQPLPPVLDLIGRMNQKPDSVIVPFVTWGCVSSGLALHAMVEALEAKKFIVPAAFKVPAQHSMMWSVEDPLGAGRPDMHDESEVREFVFFLVDHLLRDGLPETLSLEKLIDQPAGLVEAMKSASLEAAKAHFPVKTVDESLCTECGICAESCPVETITMEPLPVFGDACIWCFQCVKECPVDAIPMDLSGRVAMIRQRATDLGEPAVMKKFSSWVDIFC